MAPPPKPSGWSPDRATSFQLDAVARSYAFRPPYGATLFAKLASLVGDEPRTVLDLGCGPGDLARYLVPLFDRVDAVDMSPAMIAVGRTREHGDAANLRWIQGRAEDAPLDPPYALVVAGDSLHWMDWPVIVPRIRDVLSPNGWLAIAGKVWGTDTPEERELWSRYSTNQEYRPVHLIEELESRGFFEKRGTEGFTAEWTPTIDEYLAANRSRASYPTEPERAEAFDAELERLLDGDRLRLTVRGGVAWGVPLVPA
jgi:SAM-dependent methyltransferase